MSIKKPLYRALLIISWCFFVAAASANEGGIQVFGNAQISVAPDMATFSFSIDERGKLLEDLKVSVDEKSADLVSLCKSTGIVEKEITASEVSIRPQYNHQTKTLIGYEVSRVIKVTLNDLAKYSTLVNGAIAAGITTIRSINLDTKDRIALENKALGSAIGAAKVKAEIIASRTATRLGRVVRVEESGSRSEIGTYRFSATSADARSQGVFEPGEIAVSASVVITYAIE